MRERERVCAIQLDCRDTLSAFIDSSSPSPDVANASLKRKLRPRKYLYSGWDTNHY